jgi:anti-sigma factor RsiW
VRLQFTHACSAGIRVAPARVCHWQEAHHEEGICTPATEEPLLRELVASHVRSQMLPGHRVDVESSDQHTVKPFFEGKVDFSFAVTDFAEQDFALVGGWLDYLDNRPVAALVYRRREHLINLFIWPAPQRPDVASQTLSRQGYHLVHWTQAGMSYWAVSNLNEAELREFVRLVRDKAP